MHQRVQVLITSEWKQTRYHSLNLLLWALFIFDLVVDEKVENVSRRIETRRSGTKSNIQKIRGEKRALLLPRWNLLHKLASKILPDKISPQKQNFGICELPCHREKFLLIVASRSSWFMLHFIIQTASSERLNAREEVLTSGRRFLKQFSCVSVISQLCVICGWMSEVDFSGVSWKLNLHLQVMNQRCGYEYSLFNMKSRFCL